MPATVLAPKDILSWHLPATPLVHCRRHAYVGALLIAGTLGYMAPQLPRRDSYGDLRPTACPDIDMTLRRAFSLLTHGFPFVQAAVSLLVNISVLDRASLNILYKSLADAQMCSTCQMCKTMHDAVHYWST